MITECTAKGDGRIAFDVAGVVGDVQAICRRRGGYDCRVFRCTVRQSYVLSQRRLKNARFLGLGCVTGTVILTTFLYIFTIQKKKIKGCVHVVVAVEFADTITFLDL